MLCAHQMTQDHIRVVLRQLVIVRHLLYHVNIVFLCLLSKLRLQHHEKVVPLFPFQRYRLGVGRHLSVLDVNLTLDVSSPVVEEQHVGSGFPPKRLQSADDRDGMEMLVFVHAIILESFDDLMDSHGDDGLIVDGLLLLPF